MNRYPVTLMLALFSGVVFLVPGLTDTLQFAWSENDTTSLATSITALTSHFSHWNFDQLAWDLAAFVALGCVCERTVPRAYYVTLGLAMCVVPLAALAWYPDVGSYRGLSGIDSAIYALLACSFASDGLRSRQNVRLATGVVAWLLFVGKSIFEVTTHGTLFVHSASFVALPMTHLAGAVCGTLGSVFLPTLRA